MSGRKKKTRKRVRQPEPLIFIPPPDPAAPPPPRPSRSKHLLRRYTGLITSLALHTTILLLGLATWSVGKQVVAKVQEQVIIPDATIMEGAEVGGVPNPGI